MIDEKVVDGIRRCYELAGVPWHGYVVWLPSPRPMAIRRALSDKSDPTWNRIEARIRKPWAAAPWPLCLPGAILIERLDPSTRVRDAIGSTLDGDRYDGVFDGRLPLITVLAGMGPLGAPPDEPMLSAFADACGAGHWWPRAGVTVVCEAPVEVHVEPGGQRPHRDDGPSVRWADGYALYHVHGVAVPRSLIEGGWPGSAIHHHPNSEVRRVGIERIGWTRYIEEAGWRLVATAEDPGNQPHDLELYEDPSGREPVRILVMTNGSDDRRYAEAVPVHFSDPVEAAAWQYNCPVRVYRKLKRRT